VDAGTHIVSYGYDENGNTIRKSDSDDTDNDTVFDYDVNNRLVRVMQGTTLLGLYDYDAQGMRVRHRFSERGDVDYFYDGKSVVEERLPSGELLAHYNYADKLMSLATPAGSQYYHLDALGSTVNLTDGQGNVKTSYFLNPWGMILEQIGESVNRHVFTGKEEDENTGLVYFGQRYYDPDTGRFISQDSYLGEAGTPPSLHRYLYAYSNPTVYIDLEGYYSFKEFERDSIKWIKKTGNQFRAAAAHPIEALKGAAKETINMVPRVIESLAKAGAYDAARSSDEAAGWSNFFGDKETASQQVKIAQETRNAAKQISVPQLQLENSAQEGGAKIAAGAQLIAGFGGFAKGAVKGGGKVALKGAASDTGLSESSAVLSSESADGSLTMSKVSINSKATGPKVRQNYEAGKAFEKESLERMKINNDSVVEQVTVKTKSGTKTVLDGIGIDKNSGEISIQEYKASLTAPLTKNQKIAHPEIEESGATVVGKGKPPFGGGTEIPPTEIKIIRKNNDGV
jgi:RHS repeat-associated protein